MPLTFDRSIAAHASTIHLASARMHAMLTYGPRNDEKTNQTALGMSYYSASMSLDHTRLTSSKVVAHNTCITVVITCVTRHSVKVAM